MSTKTSAECRTIGRFGRGSTQFGRRRRHERGDFLRPELVLDVVHAQARVLVGGEDQLLADEAARPIFVDVVRPEMAADLEIVLVRRLREGRDADRVGLHLIVEDPDRLEPVLLIVEHGLVDDDEQIALGQRQRVVRAAAERRRPDLVDDELRIGLVLDVDNGEAGVAPAAIGDVVVDDGVMQAEAAVLGRPVRLLAGRHVHARQPVLPGHDRLLRVRHVDGDEDVVGEAVEQRRGVGPAPADIPQAMQTRSLDRHETDLLGIVGLREVIDRHAGRPVARGGLRLGVMIDRAFVIGLLVASSGWANMSLLWMTSRRSS